MIVGAQLADGSGAPLRAAAVRVQGDQIAEVGDLVPRENEKVVDGTGLVLAPGFIDAHNHSTEGLVENPAAESQVSQGITTLAIGQDGESPWPIAEYFSRLRSAPPAVNVVLFAGHATLRQRVMGEDFRRSASEGEIAQMRALVEQAMREGAAGLSSGLEYEIGSYAATDELLALAKTAAEHGGIYITHIRDEADRTLEAMREAIEIGERAGIPVQITHIKLGTISVWGKTGEVVSMIEAARQRGVDVSADAYPYLAWNADLKVLVPNKRYDDPVSVAQGLADVGGGHNIQVTKLPLFPQHAGKRLDEVARAEGITEVEAYIRLVADKDVKVIGHTMSEPDLRVFLAQPWTMVASDGGIASRLPRGAGTFPRVLGRFVRELDWLTLPEAIRKMTSLPAARLSLKDRGLVRPGMKADLVLFDAKTVIDRATFEQPELPSQGILKVRVNGGLVWNDGRPGGEKTGRPLALGPDRRSP